MKNKAFKIVLALLFMFSLTAFVVTFTNNKVYAEEIVDSLEEKNVVGTYTYTTNDGIAKFVLYSDNTYDVEAHDNASGETKNVTGTYIIDGSILIVDLGGENFKFKINGDSLTPIEEEQQETTSLTQEEKTKLDSIIEWLSTLNKEELFDYLNAAKNWLIAGGIVTVIGFLSAIIGLIAACLKLAREKTKNSEMSEANKQKTNELIDYFTNKLVEGNNQIKVLLLDIFNNMTDDEKKAMEANINDVRAKIEQALAESTKNE